LGSEIATTERARAGRPARRAAALPVATPIDELAGMPSVETLDARFRRRHLLLALVFVLLVLVPSATINIYLQTRAADQFVSRAAFYVLKEQAPLSTSMLTDLFMADTEEANDNDILFEFLGSQPLVLAVDARLDLRTLWRRRAAEDPVLSLPEDASVETLLRYWRRMFEVTYEPRQGVIGIAARAFTPEDARAIAEAAIAEARLLVNRLSEAARAASVKYAEEEAREARARLEQKRAELRAFRDANQVILPDADVQGQFGLLGILQRHLADALVERAKLAETTLDRDPRMVKANRRIDAITAQIAAERRRIGAAGGPEGGRLTEILTRFEELKVDLEFATSAYLSAESELARARAEAHRLTRYLAVFVDPSVPEAAEHPRRLTIGLLSSAYLVILWLTIVFVYYNVRDSRWGAR
jgi:capsular polysaccharide transport system permease protein